MSTMKAIGVYKAGEPDVLELVEVPKPTPGAEDLLVKVHAFAVNPIDTKMRKGGGYGTHNANTARILGWDASGVVESVGAGTMGFAVGDEVYFAGSLFRAGSNAEYVAVDYRLVAAKPKSIDHTVAASMPLTLITAWEAIEKKFGVKVPATGSEEEKINASKTILIVAGAGGVGSIAIQLAKRIFKIGKVVATAGRADSQAWCLKLGADLVLNRSTDYETQLKEADVAGFDYILSCTAIDDILENLISILNPFGHIASIVNAQKPLALQNLFRKVGSLSFEFMGGRPVHNYHQEEHGSILSRGAALVDNGTIVPWVGTTYDAATVENVRAAHALQETGTAIGKITIVAKF